MDGSNESCNSPAPFLVKTYEMVDDPYTNPVVSWSQTGHSFIVWNPPEFAGELLPKYFKHNNFSSFIRQLNTYGFRKIDPQQWEFANEEFIRGQKRLLKNIHRRKPIHSHSGQGNAALLPDSERESFEMEIEKLKRAKVLLHSELERHKHENQEYEYQIRSLGQTLQTIDQRQRQLMVTFAQLLEKPAYTLSTIEQSETHNKKRRSLALHFLHGEGNLGESHSTNFFLENSSRPLLNLGQVEKLDSSLNFWEKFIEGVDQNPSRDLPDLTLHRPISSPVITETTATSGDSDLNVHMSASPSRNHHSSAELEASSTYVDSSAVSSICIDLDTRMKPLAIDVNLSPTKISDTQTAKDGKQDGTVPSMPAGTNDVFWQQFFSEAPGSSMVQEVQSESRD